MGDALSLRPRSPLARYAVAVFATALAFALTLGLESVMARNPFLFFVVAVVVSAWFGGLGPGLLSSALSALGSLYFLRSPAYSVFASGAEEGARLSVFLFVAIVINAAFFLRQQAETQLRKREQQEQIIFDAVPAMIWYKDKDNRILRANKTAAASMGLQVKDLEGKSTHDLYPEEATRYYQDDLKVILTGQPRRGIVEPYRIATGEMRWVRTDKIPYRNDSGDIIGVIVFAVDITERVQAEDALHKTHADLERLVQERTQSLTHANEALRTQVQERLQAEKALQRAYEELEWRVSERTAELARSQEQLRALAVHMESVREEERTTIARDIHDELGQALTALNMDLSWMRNRLPQSKPMALLHDKASAMAGLITHTIESVRRIATELRPGVLDQLGLVAAMEWQASAFQKRYGIACRLVLPAGEIELNAQRSTALFRMLQEALTNVVRHAGATSVTITLDTTDAEVRLTVEDDGKGLSEESLAAPLSLGIVGMRERALALGGVVRIQGIPGSGTTVAVSLPLSGGSHDAEASLSRADRG
jgi:PAS domain S-box-containing protein